MREAISDVAGAVQAAHKEWGWYLTLGIALILLGGYCIYAETVATLASVMVIGAVILLSGIVQIVAAFMARSAGHIILLLLIGALDIVVGWMLLQHPEFGALILTLFLAVLFVFSGIYRIFAALWLQFPYYGWVIFSGLVSVVLGILLWAQWPVSAFWFIGFAVGLSFVFEGISLSSLALRLKAI